MKQEVIKSDEQLRAECPVVLQGDDIIRVTFLKEENGEKNHIRSVALILADIDEIVDAYPGKIFLGIGDLTPIFNKISLMSNEIREGYRKIVEHPRIKRIAILGANKFFEIATNFMFHVSSDSNRIKLFSNEKEAIEWLREK
jgi:hypothetical protein